MKRYTFIIIITLVIQIILQTISGIINNTTLGFVPAIITPLFFITMFIFCVFNRNVSNWMDKRIWGK